MSKNISIKNGSGAYVIEFDADKKIAAIDFSGVAPLFPGDCGCYRNDSTVFLFVANSYKYAHLKTRESIEAAFEANRSKDVEHLIIPYFYLFRHYLELIFKSFYMAITQKMTDNSHNIYKLFDLVVIESSKIDDSKYNKDKYGFEFHKNQLNLFLDQLRKDLDKFLLLEPQDSYYRYLYDVNAKLENPIIRLDFANQNQLFDQIMMHIVNLEVEYMYLIGFNYTMG